MLLKSCEMGLGDKLQLVLREGAPDFLGWQLLVVATAMSLQEDPCGGWRAWVGWDGLGSVPWLLSNVGWANFPCLRTVALITVCHCHTFDAAFGDYKTKPHLASSEGISVSWHFLYNFWTYQLRCLVLRLVFLHPASLFHQERTRGESGTSLVFWFIQAGSRQAPTLVDCREGAENSNDRRLELMPLSFPMKRATVWLGWGTLKSGQAGRTCKGCGIDSGTFMPGRESEVCPGSSLESLRIFWVRRGGIISDLNTSSGSLLVLCLLNLLQTANFTYYLGEEVWLWCCCCFLWLWHQLRYYQWAGPLISISVTLIVIY